MASKLLARDEYYRALNLPQDPFLNTYNKEFYFVSSELQHRMELVKHLLEFSQQVLLISGVENAGKTFFTTHLMSTVSDDWLVCRIIADSETGVDSLVNTLLSQSSIASNDGPESIELLNKFLLDCNNTGKTPILIIDKAENLNPTTLRFIFQLLDFKEQDTFIRIVLLAQESLIKTLNEITEERGSLNLVHTVNIPALNIEETTTYLHQRMEVCGGNGKLFSNKEIRRIHKVSGGLPGYINFLARQGLSDPAELNLEIPTASKHPGTTGGEWRGMGVSVVVLLGIAALFLAWSYLQPEKKKDTEVVSLELPKPVTAVTESKPNAIETDDFLSITNDDINPKLASGTSQHSDKEFTESSLFTSNKPSIADDSDDKKDDAELLKTSAVQQIPVKAEFEQKLEQDLAGIAGIRDQAWLLKQEADSYVIQLIGAVETSTIERFLELAPLDKKQLSLYRSGDASKPWHVLVYGLYPDRNTARAAINELPELARKEKPWAKSVLSIQKAIKSP